MSSIYIFCLFLLLVYIFTWASINFIAYGSCLILLSLGIVLFYQRQNVRLVFTSALIGISLYFLIHRPIYLGEIFFIIGVDAFLTYIITDIFKDKMNDTDPMRMVSVTTAMLISLMIGYIFVSIIF